jgi:hypothetical protein
VAEADLGIAKRTCFHRLHVVAPPLPSFPPTSRATYLHQRLHFGSWPQGENEPFPLPSMDAPAFEPRGKGRSHRAAALPPLVMPAIEQGWVECLAGVPAFINACALFA